jgi:anti-sigma-K factor RskA
MSDIKNSTNPALDAAISEAVVSVVTHKSIWASKTFWTNIIAAVAVTAQMRWGYVFDPSLQMLALAAINTALRKITNQAVEW